MLRFDVSGHLSSFRLLVRVAFRASLVLAPLGVLTLVGGCATGALDSRSAAPAREASLSHTATLRLQLDSELGLWSAGVLTPARLFRSESPPLWLVTWPRADPWLVDPISAAVHQAPAAEIDGQVARLPSSAIALRGQTSTGQTSTGQTSTGQTSTGQTSTGQTSLGKATRVAEVAPLGTIELEADGLRLVTLTGIYRVADRPALLGELSPAEILTGRPSYRFRMESYRPDARALESLKRLGGDHSGDHGAGYESDPEVNGDSGEPPLEVWVLFGTWCVSCQHFVPYSLRIEEELRGLAFRWHYLGVAQPERGERDPVAATMGVDRVPTAVVRRGSEELGRIVGPDGFRSFERQLLGILTPNAAATP